MILKQKMKIATIEFCGEIELWEPAPEAFIVGVGELLVKR